MEMNTYDDLPLSIAAKEEDLEPFEKNDIEDMIPINKEKLRGFLNQVQDFYSYNKIKETYLYSLIKNLLKKVDYLNLSLQLAEEQISDGRERLYKSHPNQ